VPPHLNNAKSITTTTTTTTDRLEQVGYYVKVDLIPKKLMMKKSFFLHTHTPNTNTLYFFFFFFFCSTSQATPSQNSIISPNKHHHCFFLLLFFKILTSLSLTCVVVPLCVYIYMEVSGWGPRKYFIIPALWDSRLFSPSRFH